MTEGRQDHSMLEGSGITVADFRDADDNLGFPDRRDGKFYRYTPDIKLAVRVAIALGRPLLVFGPSGCGKSSLVFNLARLFRRRYYEFVVHSRSEARDLFYRFDAVRRLGEAQIAGRGIADDEENWRSCYPFIEPGPLWWVFNPQIAKLRGPKRRSSSVKPALDPGRWPDDYADPSDHKEDPNVAPPPAVLLIDEIDKADPDFPNNLLVPLGSREFIVEETGDLIKFGNDPSGDSAPLIVITSNRERELPVAFIRRCVVLEIKPLNDDELIDLAKKTFRIEDDKNVQIWKRVAELLRGLRPRDQVSPVEFLDAIKAVQSLGGSENQWQQILLKTSWTSDLGDA
jgi:MoxR-like ATPase